MKNRLRFHVSAYIWLMLLCLTGAHAQTPAASATPSVTRSIRGNGTTGQLPKWIASDTIGDSIVTESNGNIGIGTTAPGSKLTVAGRIEAFTEGIIPAIFGRSESGIGVRGNSDSSFGVFGSSNTSRGVQGLSNSGDGVFGFSLTGNGVRGDTSNPTTAGVFGFNNGNGGTGVRGVSITGFGVFGSSDTFTAVEARSNSGFGVFGSSSTNTGVHGQSQTKTGVFGTTGGVQGFGVWGVNTSAGTAVVGEAPNGTGVVGSTNSDLGTGVLGLNNGRGEAIRAQTLRGIGVFSNTATGIALLGVSEAGTAVAGVSGSGPAGSFNGDVSISGMLTKGGGSFKIDHPLDPANKTLSHSFVESPDMMNIYNGNVITDQLGEATVTLPAYFEALNSDYRYQLTVIGQYAQAIVADEVKNNRFRITTNIPNVKVSWQVTGVRRDAWATRHRITVEEEKPQGERGYYLHPELFGQTEDRDIEWVRRPELMNRIKGIKQRLP